MTVIGLLSKQLFADAELGHLVAQIVFAFAFYHGFAMLVTHFSASALCAQWVELQGETSRVAFSHFP